MKVSDHRQAQHVVTTAVLIAFASEILFELFAPDLQGLSKYFNLGACLVWIWIE